MNFKIDNKDYDSEKLSDKGKNNKWHIQENHLLVDSSVNKH